MTFSSPIFLFVFLPTVIVFYYLIQRKWRNAFLLLSSLVFYAWGEPRFVFVLILSSLLNYGFGLIICKMESSRHVRLNACLMTICVVLNLALLFIYKYLDFSISIVNDFFHLNLPAKNIVLPIGISFFTFQGMSYVLDVYQKRVRAQRNPIHVMLYVAMFPQLVAGPIVRYTDICQEITDRSIDPASFCNGIQRFVIGLAKKMILANTFAYVVDAIFAQSPHHLSVSVTWLGALCYSMQIYYDFSGYSDMAIGLGRMLGFHFNENFDHPYTAISITDFWRRWHISLSAWFKDYLYIPLGGSRKGNVYLHLMIVFLATGIWHGAAWTFVLWGLYHGVLRVTEKLTGLDKKEPRGLISVGAWALTMLLVLLGWVLFRADSLQYAVEYFLRMIGMLSDCVPYYPFAWYCTRKTALVIICCIICAYPWKLLFEKRRKHMSATALATFKLFKILLLSAIFLLSIMLVMVSSYNPFIYFRF